jgi:outer membrane protein TolC
LAELDVIQAEAEVADRNQQLVVARYNKRILEDRLKKLIFPQMDPGMVSVSLVPTSEPDPPPEPTADVAEGIQLALEVRPEVRRLMLDLENKKIDVDYTKNQLRPTLDFVASYSQHGLGGDLIERDFSQGFFNAPVVREEPGGFWNSMDSLFSRRFIGYTLGFSFKVPIGNNEARANNAQAQISQRQSQERLRSLRQTIALEVRQSYEWMERNRASVEAAEVTVRYQDKRVQGEQDKYNLGANTTRFVLEAQRDLQNAHSVLLQARIDLIKSRVAVDKALGNIFAAHNIELRDALRSFK